MPGSRQWTRADALMNFETSVHKRIHNVESDVADLGVSGGVMMSDLD